MWRLQGRLFNGRVIGRTEPSRKKVGRYFAKKHSNGIWFIARAGKVIRPPQ